MRPEPFSLWRHRNVIGLLVLATLSVPSTEPLGVASPTARSLYTDHPATWFEDVAARASISPDGRWAIYGPLRDGPRLVDLETGRDESNRLRTGLSAVRAAVFDGRGRIVRFGQRGAERGWFVPDERGDLQLSSVPADARPQWSPRDERAVAFVRAQHPELGVFAGPLDEIKPHVVDGRITGLVWAHDGRSVYVLTCNERGTSTLFRVTPSDNASNTIVAENLDADPRASSIAVAADGRRAYIALASGGAPDPLRRHQPAAKRDLDIYEVDLITGARRAIVKEAGDDFAPAVVNGHLYWTRSTRRHEIGVVAASGGEVRRVVANAELPSWSPNSRQIAVTYGDWRLADWALNLDAGIVDVDADARATSAMRPFVTGYHEDFTPFWSPDGRWIAYHSHRSKLPVAYYGASGAADDIFLRAVSGTMADEIRLTDIGWESGPADWSPDGRRLVFSSWERGGTPGVAKPWIVTIDPSTGRPLAVVPLRLPDTIKSVDWVAWSPRGDFLAIEEATREGRHSLWTIGADGSSPHKIVEYDINTYGGVAWTPNGTDLVYAALVDRHVQIVSIPAQAGTPKPLTHDSANLLHPRVSPDGRWIAVTRLLVTKEIWRMKLP